MTPDEFRREFQDLSARLVRIEEWLGFGEETKRVDPEPAVDDAGAVVAREPHGIDEPEREARAGGIEVRGGAKIVEPLPPASPPAEIERTECIEEDPSPCDQAEERAPVETSEPAAPVAIPIQYAGSRPVRSATESPAALPPTVAPPLESAGVKISRRRTTPAETTGQSLELQIGMKWMAWIGAILVIVAVGFFVKMAYDLGWWGHVSPLGKCLLATAFGGLMLAGGELTMRKVGRFASVSFFGAGLGVLYLTALSTFRFFHLLPESGARVLMIVVALLGVAITIRGRMLSIGILSILGGYLSPLILHTAPTFPTSLPLYLTALLAIGLALSALLPTPFRVLRYVTMGLHGAVALGWLLQEVVLAQSPVWLLALVFMTIWWAMVTAEALYAALRGQSPTGNALASLFATVWFSATGCWVIGAVQTADRNWLGVFTFGIAAIAAPIALFFGPGLAVLRSRPREAMEKLAVTLWAQVGILVATAIGLHFNQAGNSYGQTIGWLAMSVACIESGRRLRSRGVDVFALIVGALALWRVWTIDPGIFALRAQIWSGAGVTITYWSLIALASVAATHFVALRIRDEAQRPALPGILAVIGTLGWLAWCVAQCDGLALTSGWLLGAVLLLAAERFGQRQRYLGIAHFVLAVTAAKWLVIDALGTRFGSLWDPNAVLPVLNWQMALAAALAVAFWYASWLPRPRRLKDVLAPVEVAPRSPSLRAQITLVVGALFLVLALCFEVDRLLGRLESADGWSSPWSPTHARMLWLTLLWAGGGLVMTISGCLQRRKLMLAAGWAVLLLGAFAWLTADTLGPRADAGIVLSRVVLNVQFLIGGVVAAALAVALWFTAPALEGASGTDRFVARAMRAVAFVLAAIPLWLGSLEIDRLFGHLEASEGWSATWAPWHSRLLWFTLLWAVGGVAMILFGRLRPRQSMFALGWTILIGCAIAFLTGDTLLPRVNSGTTLCRVVFNAQFCVGVLLAALFGVALWFTRSVRVDRAVKDELTQQALAFGFAVLAAIPLWIISLEIDRYFGLAIADAIAAGRASNAAMVRLTTWSIFWGVYGIGLVALGFAVRSAWCRYGGLALFALTLGKVLLIDLKEVEAIYRVLSLLGVGLLAMATSVAYAKLSSRFSVRPAESEHPVRP